MKFNDFIKLIEDDFSRYTKNKKRGFLIFCYNYIKYPGLKYTVHLRLCKYLKQKKVLFPLYIIARVVFRHLSIKYGIQMPYYVDIQGGLKITHYNCIVINGKSKIGKNLDIRQGTTIGSTDKGAPKIGDNVYLGANSVIIGNITIGDNVIVGANSTVTQDIPNNCTVVGINRIVNSK